MLRFFFTYVFFIIYPAVSFSELRIDITRGNTEPIPVALVKFQTNSDSENKISLDIKKVISNNLQRSGLFTMLPKTIFLTEKLNFDSKPSFSDWKITTAQGLIHGDLSINGEKLKLKFRLWDVF